jgi:hypothetical protein
MSTQILILGGFGRVGLETTRYLLAHSEYRLTLASRRPRPLPPDLAAADDRVATTSIDVNYEARLADLCSEHDLVIASIGPSGLLGNRVARACIDRAVPLLDPGGYDPLLHELEAMEQERTIPIPLVFNAGLLPGLTGLFPRHLIERHGAGRQPSAMECHYVGRDAWTYASAWDIVHSLGDFGAERGFCAVENGRLQQIRLSRAFTKTTLPAPIGKVTTALTYTEEIGRLGRELAIPTLRVYGTNNGPRSALVMITAKLLRLYRSPRGIDLAARWLVRASARDMRRLQPVFAIATTLHYSDGATTRGTLQVGNTYRATGTVLGIAARQLISTASVMPGVRMLHEAVDTDEFMALFNAAAITTQMDIEEL